MSLPSAALLIALILFLVAVSSHAYRSRAKARSSEKPKPQALSHHSIERRDAAFDLTGVWSSLLALEDPQPFLHSCITGLMRPDGGGAAVEHNRWLHIVDRRGKLMFSALGRKASAGPLQIHAMYPYSESGYLWPIEIDTVEAHAGVGCVIGRAFGAARIGVFDTTHFRSAYEPTMAYTFQVSAIALRLAPEDFSQRASGVTYTDDFCGYGPVLNEQGAVVTPDVVEVHSVIQAVESVAFWGVSLTRYLLTLAKPGDAEMTLDVYANDTVIGRRFAVGERVTGHLWIFGFHPPQLPPTPVATV